MPSSTSLATSIGFHHPGEETAVRRTRRSVSRSPPLRHHHGLHRVRRRHRVPVPAGLDHRDAAGPGNPSGTGSGCKRSPSRDTDVAEPSDAELLRGPRRRRPGRLPAAAAPPPRPAVGGRAAHVGDPEEAADALQDALLSAHRAAARFRGDSAVTTWLHRIVVNACLDRLRRQRSHPTVPLPDGQRRRGRGRRRRGGGAGRSSGGPRHRAHRPGRAGAVAARAARGDRAGRPRGVPGRRGRQDARGRPRAR